jgi:hypothetical protein
MRKSFSYSNLSISERLIAMMPLAIRTLLATCYSLTIFAE